MNASSKFHPCLAAVLFTAFTIVSAFAQTPEQTPEQVPKFEFRLGGFLVTDINTRMQLSTDTRPGTSVDFNSLLGGESSANVFRADGNWRFAARHQLDASWFDIDLTGRRTITADINFGDQTYPINSTLESRFRTSIYKLAYGYVFMHTDRHEITGLLGVHIMNIETSVGLVDHSRIERFTVTAPLPVFGLAWKAHWTDRLETNVSLQYFGISVDSGKYSGHLTDGLALVQYRIWRNVGFGAGYNRFDIDAEAVKGPLHLSMKHSYNGLLVYIFTKF